MPSGMGPSISSWKVKSVKLVSFTNPFEYKTLMITIASKIKTSQIHQLTNALWYRTFKFNSTKIKLCNPIIAVDFNFTFFNELITCTTQIDLRLIVRCWLQAIHFNYLSFTAYFIIQRVYNTYCFLSISFISM